MKNSKNKKNNYTLLFSTLFLFCIAIYGFLFPENIISITDHFSLFSEGYASDAEITSQTKAEKQEKTSTSKESEKGNKPKKESNAVSDNSSYIQYLDERKAQLDRKEQDLKELEEKLHIEKLALEKTIEELEGKRREIASKLENRVKEDEENIMKLVGFYSNMKPQNAAQVMSSVDDNLAISILKRMKKQNAGEILNFMAPDKAKALSEKYTGY
ncbi:MAG: hypothetical protein H6623_09800 [Bdellovibrionaceae bacterium]|nr:hypothetical protein [Pseudobdellovibrionaceae bacterium]